MRSCRRWSWCCALSVLLAGFGLLPAALPVAAQGLTVLPLVNARVGDRPLPVTIVAGHRFFGRGAGFRPGERLKLSISFPLYGGSYLLESRTATATGDGTSPGVLMSVPNDTRSGVVPLSVRGEASGREASARLRVVYRPSIRLASPTIRPGQPAVVDGSGFVPGSSLEVSVVIPQTGGPTETLTQSATGDQNGAFAASISIPGSATPGRYTVTVTDPARAFQAHATLTVSVRPSISLGPNPIYPGHTVTISGSGFPAFASITLAATFPLYGGKSQRITTRVRSDARGNFTGHLLVPARATDRVVRVSASAPNARAGSRLQIRPTAAQVTLSPTPVSPAASGSVQRGADTSTGSSR